MADINSSLPVRTQTAGDVSVKIDQTTPGTTNAVQIIGSVVPGTGATHLGKAEDAAHSDGDTGVMALGVRSDAGTQVAGSNTEYTPLTTDALGKLWIAGSHVDDTAFTPATSRVVIAGAEFDDSAPDSVDEGDGGALRMSGRRELYVQIRDAAGNERGLNVDASGRIATTTSFGDAAVAGDVCSYSTVSGLGAATATTTQHQYTVANTTFLLKQVIAAASGKIKVEIQSGPTASLTTKAVVFTSTAQPFANIQFEQPIEVPVTSTGIVRVIVTNNEAVSQDTYVTIIGNDI